jgi:hypothetical protein
MLTLPIVLLAVLLVVVAVANSRKKKGVMTKSSYSTLVSVLAVLVTGVALLALYLRLRM